MPLPCSSELQPLWHLWISTYNTTILWQVGIINSVHPTRWYPNLSVGPLHYIQSNPALTALLWPLTPGRSPAPIWAQKKKQKKHKHKGKEKEKKKKSRKSDSSSEDEEQAEGPGRVSTEELLQRSRVGGHPALLYRRSCLLIDVPPGSSTGTACYVVLKIK